MVRWTRPPAVHGHGATVNGTPLRVSDATLGAGLVSVPTAQLGMTDNAAIACEIIARGMRLYSVACITYVGALVAAGRITGGGFPSDTGAGRQLHRGGLPHQVQRPEHRERQDGDLELVAVDTPDDPAPDPRATNTTGAMITSSSSVAESISPRATENGTLNAFTARKNQALVPKNSRTLSRAPRR